LQQLNVLVIKQKLLEGTSEKESRTIFENKNDVVLNIVNCFNLKVALKNTFLFINRKVFVAT